MCLSGTSSYNEIWSEKTDQRDAIQNGIESGFGTGMFLADNLRHDLLSNTLKMRRFDAGN